MKKATNNNTTIKKLFTEIQKTAKRLEKMMAQFQVLQSKQSVSQPKMKKRIKKASKKKMVRRKRSSKKN